MKASLIEFFNICFLVFALKVLLANDFLSILLNDYVTYNVCGRVATSGARASSGSMTSAGVGYIGYHCATCSQVRTIT